jgi:hypothetical protein
MTFANLGPFFVQAFLLGALVLKILSVLGIAGAGLLVGLLPRFCKLRWVVFAPLSGLAAITLGSLPLSLLGCTAGGYAWPLLLTLSAFSTTVCALAFRASSARRRRRLWWGYVRHCWRWLVIGFVAVVLLSAKMLTYSGQSKIDAAWGSTDFGAYWIVADYLQHHGAEPGAYEAQNQYRASDIDDHLHLHARLGCMSSIAVLGEVIVPGRLSAIINPLLVASLLAMTALVQAFAQRERLWLATGTLVVIFHPFLYFLLFYTYLSQAFSVVLIAAGLLVAEADWRRSGPGTRWLSHIGIGLFFAAALLDYPSAMLAPVLFFAGKLIFHFRRDGFISALVAGGTVLMTAGYYLPQILRELEWLQHARELPGWNWNRWADVHELLGLRNVISFQPLPPSEVASTIVTIAITALVAAALVVHFRKGALPFTAAAFVGSSAMLAISAYFKFQAGVPHASHGFAKAISQYALIILVFVAAGAVATAATRAQRKRVQTMVVIVLGWFALIQFLQVSRWRRAAWFDYDLIVLVERHVRDATRLSFDPALDHRLVAPLALDERRIRPAENREPVLRFALASLEAAPIGEEIVDREGPYIALLLK